MSGVFSPERVADETRPAGSSRDLEDRGRHVVSLEDLPEGFRGEGYDLPPERGRMVFPIRIVGFTQSFPWGEGRYRFEVAVDEIEDAVAAGPCRR
jgi:hypothetical protein